MAESMGRRLAGRYEIRSLIGRGGMAEVHLGFDTRLSRIVAIKMLRSDLARDSVFQARFRREAQSAASLNHPNIVAVYDTGEEMVLGPDGRGISVPYIVMEYVEGHTVKDLLSDGTPVPINEAVSIVSGVLSALEYSHSQHLVHRDIKPGNIMLTADGKVKVMDFGIARALSDSQATMTQTNAVVGTAQYLSPEQARGEQVDARSDLYSTGVVLFELLTGRPPFTGDSAVAVAYQHVQQLAPTPSAITPDVPEPLDRVVLKALAKNREDRYSSAGSMLADLMRATRGGRVNAPETAVWADTRTMPAPAEQTATLPAAPAFAPVQSPTSTVPSLKADEVEQPEKGRKKMWIVLGVILAALLIVGGVWYALARSQPTAEMVAVPDNLVGMSEADAKAAVESVGLVFAVSDKTVASEELAEGMVAEVDPPSGERVEVGTTVTAKLSSGSDSVVIPEITNMTPEAAQEAVEALGLVWELDANKVDSDSVEEGKIAKVNPSVGKKVKKGSTVKGTVSSGKKTVTVPDLTGMTQDQAREYLTQVGLQVGNVQTSDDPSQSAGKILSSSPAAGETLNKGESVSITVASGKVALPDTIVGYEQASVVAALQALTLDVSIVEEYSDTLAAGGVLSSSPSSGSIVPQGSTVHLTVSKGPKPTSPSNNSGNSGSGNGNGNG
ncbi:MAG: Stk1 family PASTA domain-containing Ser/Thr kinase [Schaalia hyovaginalis]|uniref:Stk1 family PASTA domain-containing Ser/Thr kinase n=1 Tax=Schaalia hyovaginalis TaxID=29316 RepID=UPI0026EE0643|nr:Stk1 family PASTA domain-containing Ser/Thr kinase [Schaalia hyovaginalis]MCI6410539.1 Stk1 family PASTA domain-containing Ser/Thr kinase [Schaalia hyovaginalis]MDD7554204.1 Stk1 family PASTA domain-containing Ser/Thr kinase [Schaalia hyovaginalis]MDY3093899.1 Stk1 family PASTA domain-containing Ser/Thr kinase [Schaalia hyovaginalis]MDY3665212.1 Stk1 family PASTA domain-containing Ser/Thr kinase [Schaalia hyovaginalis]MDY4261837.1 Stk1 family PASTA domain-containing Ser/Thr kinase [Schaalia